MSHGLTTVARDTTSPRGKVRPRSLPSTRPFTSAAIFSAFFYVSVITTATALALFLTDPNHLAMQVLLGSLALSVVMGLVSFFKRRGAHCPLCKGTPLVSSGALAHSRAVRLFPFNHGTTATLSIIATHTFRCMYCGSDFDLLKKPSHLRGKDDYTE